MDQAPRYRLINQTLTRLLTASLLLLAAYFKYDQLLWPGIRQNRHWHLLLVVGELLLAIWLVAGLFRRAAFAVAIATFSGFALASLQRAMAGSPTCGCFGRVEVNPWLVFALDTLIVVLLALWFPCKSSIAVTPRGARLVATITLAAALVLFTSYKVATYQPGRLQPDGTIAGDPRHIELLPETWLNQPFPLAAYLMDAPDLSAGRWTLMFVRHNCPLCHNVLEDLAASADAEEDRIARLVIVEIPPYGPLPDRAQATFRIAQLPADREWTLATPTVVKLIDGIVTFADQAYVTLPTTTPAFDAATTQP